MKYVLKAANKARMGRKTAGTAMKPGSKDWGRGPDHRRAGATVARVMGNGEVVWTRPPNGRRTKFLVYIILALFVICWLQQPSDPFADGPVPAVAREPSEHWDKIKGWKLFVRDFTGQTNTVGSRRASVSTVFFGAHGGPTRAVDHNRLDFGATTATNPRTTTATSARLS